MRFFSSIFLTTGYRFRRTALFLCALSVSFFALQTAFAGPIDDVYPHRVDPALFDTLKKGPNAQIYGYRQVIVMMRSDVPLTAVNASSASARVLMYGKYNSPRGIVDLELRGDIRAGVLEIDFPLGRVDAVLFDWEENAARPDELKTLRPRIRSLTFREASGFRAVYVIERTFPYQLTVDIPYNPVTKNLMPPQPKFGDVAEFVKALESREHARAILQNNGTGLPAFLTTDDDPSILVAGYLLNSVKWHVKDDRWEYVYDDELKDIRNFPEIKQLLKSPEVKAFLGNDNQARVKAYGGEKTGYSFSLSSGARKLEATLIGRRVAVKPAPMPAGLTPKP